MIILEPTAYSKYDITCVRCLWKLHFIKKNSVIVACRQNWNFPWNYVRNYIVSKIWNYKFIISKPSTVMIAILKITFALFIWFFFHCLPFHILVILLLLFFPYNKIWLSIGVSLCYKVLHILMNLILMHCIDIQFIMLK